MARTLSDILSLGFLFFNIFQCTPISYFWLRWDGEHEGHCVDANKVTLSGGIIDLFCFLLPSRHPAAYARLASEIRDTFADAKAIKSGPLLASCTLPPRCH